MYSTRHHGNTRMETQREHKRHAVKVRLPEAVFPASTGSRVKARRRIVSGDPQLDPHCARAAHRSRVGQRKRGGDGRPLDYISRWHNHQLHGRNCGAPVGSAQRNRTGVNAMSRPSSISIDRFQRLFCGYDLRFGRSDFKRDANGHPVVESRKIETDNRTVHESITRDDFAKHLNGHNGIGVIPLCEDDTVHFAAIDIDIYNEDPEWPAQIAKRIRTLPLTVTLSKSSGLHIWLHSFSGMPAKTAVEYLKAVASQLGYAGCEIFPKQIRRFGKDDVGNWINLPYFGDTRTIVWWKKHTATGNLHPGENDIVSFLDFCERNAEIATAEYIARATTELRTEDASTDSSQDWLDGPPCLQRLLVGDPERAAKVRAAHAAGKYKDDDRDLRIAECDPQIADGTRNTVFFNAAQYLYRKYGSREAVYEHLNTINELGEIGLCTKEIAGVSAGAERSNTGTNATLNR